MIKIQYNRDDNARLSVRQRELSSLFYSESTIEGEHMKEGKKGILRAIPMFLCVGVACCALQSFYRVSEQEQAVVTRFGLSLIHI